MYSAAYVWAKILGYLEEQLTPAVVATWFDDTEVVDFSNDQLILYVPATFRRDTIRKRYADVIIAALQDRFKAGSDAKLILLDEEEMNARKSQQKQQNAFEFNPQFTFEKFVVGPSNRFAHAAAIAVANNPAGSYNPLFIYGDSGLGKTHLLYAIATQVRCNNPDANIVYIKGDQFTNELISALQAGKNVEFRQKYRSADLFLVDDIQFIAGKTSTQEEFFHTFNTLFESHKQIVLTSDRPPEEMLRLEDRLRTRFEWGLLADIEPPDYETRLAIIRNKCMELGLDMPDDVSRYIAENVTNNVRQIEGTVKKIMAYRDLSGITIDVASVSRAIKDMYKSGGDKQTLPTPALIISEVSRFYSVEESQIRGTQKNRGTAEARQIAMYLCRKLTNLSLPDIGREFGKDHSTVIHAIQKIEKMLVDPQSGTQDTIHDITASINAKL